MNPLLEPLGRAYGTLMAARNAAFDSGWFNAERVDVPVIAVGNLSVGGTGKTPLVEFLLGMLIDQGRRPAMVSRGYGRTSGGVVIVSRK
jgi:tetraacyldisaccharide 4'-kinase